MDELRLNWFHEELVFHGVNLGKTLQEGHLIAVIFFFLLFFSPLSDKQSELIVESPTVFTRIFNFQIDDEMEREGWMRQLTPAHRVQYNKLRLCVQPITTARCTRADEISHIPDLQGVSFNHFCSLKVLYFLPFSKIDNSDGHWYTSPLYTTAAVEKGS